MNKRQLLQLANYNQNNIIQVIRNDYFQYIKDELRRIVGHADNSIIEDIINDAAVNLSTVWDDCDISFLVFDCIRKKVISVCKTDAVVRAQTNIDILRESEFPSAHSPVDDLRLDIVLLFLSKKQRKYFLERYYYLRNDIRINRRYERIIYKLFNGKGIASLRFRHFNIPYKKVTPKLYADYLDRLDNSYLGQLNTEKTFIVCRNVSDVPNMIIIAEREYGITKISVPICFILLLFFVLLYFAVFY